MDFGGFWARIWWLMLYKVEFWWDLSFWRFALSGVGSGFLVFLVIWSGFPGCSVLTGVLRYFLDLYFVEFGVSWSRLRCLGLV